MLNKKSVDDINVKGKRVLVRCDFNVPLQDGKITDENRLVAALPTIKKLIADGGKVILCSHLGKPKGEPKPELSLAPVAKRLTELLGQEVKFAADPEVVGPNAKAAVAAMKDGDVVVLRKQSFLAEPIVKRVIATEGQTVDIDFVTGQVYVDGELLEETYINEPTWTEEGTQFPLTVPEGSLFVMGDNRNHSNDSRDARLGTVDARCVIGRAVLLVFPGPDSVTGQRDFGRLGLIGGVSA